MGLAVSSANESHCLQWRRKSRTWEYPGGESAVGEKVRPSERVCYCEWRGRGIAGGEEGEKVMHFASYDDDPVFQPPYSFMPSLRRYDCICIRKGGERPRVNELENDPDSEETPISV